jgi:hypothetical protein
MSENEPSLQKEDKTSKKEEKPLHPKSRKAFQIKSKENRKKKLDFKDKKRQEDHSAEGMQLSRKSLN